MRSGESLIQCAMFIVNDQLHVVATINKRNGRGKIIIGTSQPKKRMRIIRTVSRKELHNVSDVEVTQTSNGNQLLVVGQASPNGKCYVYRRSSELEGG